MAIVNGWKERLYAVWAAKMLARSGTADGFSEADPSSRVDASRREEAASGGVR